jgi:hypothetical protein
VSIYGYVYSDLGKKFLDLGLGPLAQQEFEAAVKYSPDLWQPLAPFMKQ